MADDEVHPIEHEVRQKQDNAIDALTGLRKELATLSVEMSKRPTDEQLRIQLNDSRKALEYNRKRGLTGLRVGGLLLMLVFVLFGTPLLINSFANRSTANTIKNCTTPGPETHKDHFDTGHKCFDDGQRRIADILTRAASNEVLILTCYRDPNGVLRPQDQFIACVRNKLGVDG
jgi:hypothetical protein